MKIATNNYVLDYDEAEAIAAYGGDAEPEDFQTIVVLDNAAEKTYDTYNKDQKVIGHMWKEWAEKRNDFFTALGTAVPEANKHIYAEHLNNGYPKGALGALQAYTNPPNEQRIPPLLRTTNSTGRNHHHQ